MRVRAEEKEKELACACALREKSGNWMSGAPRTKKYRIGMRLRNAEDKEKESACALRKERSNWHARSAGGKEQELDVWRAEDKEWDRYALTRLSIPEDKVKG